MAAAQPAGPQSWAAGYDRELTQWSKGEYPDANRREDDLAIITGSNGFSYRSDDHVGVVSLGTGGIDVFAEGIIERNTDIDGFSFTTGTGTVTLDIDPFYRSPNLDILATLHDGSGNVIAVSNPIDDLGASFSQFLTAGYYYFSVQGTGKLPTSTGYSDYGSLGYYSITGQLAPDNTPPVVSGLPNITAR